MTEIIVGLSTVIIMCFIFSAYLDYRIRRAELSTYIGCAIAFEPDGFYVNYHNSEPVSGIETVLQYDSKGDFLYTFIFEENSFIRVMVHEKKCMDLRKSLNIVCGDHTHKKLNDLKNKLIAEDK